MHEERKTKQKTADNDSKYGNPNYLLERENQIRAKVLSNTIKQKRKEKAVSFSIRNHKKQKLQDQLNNQI